MTNTDQAADIIECAYCNAYVPLEGEYVPDSTDDEEWERLAKLHNSSCEWVETRAHRIFTDD